MMTNKKLHCTEGSSGTLRRKCHRDFVMGEEGRRDSLFNFSLTLLQKEFVVIHKDST